MLEFLTMALYSLLRACVLVLGSPYWLGRAARGGSGWASGLLARLGRVPRELREAVEGRKVIWVHAVSVGEVGVDRVGSGLNPEVRELLSDRDDLVLDRFGDTGG